MDRTAATPAEKKGKNMGSLWPPGKNYPVNAFRPEKGRNQ